MVEQSQDYFGIEIEGENVVFLIDISGSMEGKDEGSFTEQVVREATEQGTNIVEEAIGGKLGQLIGTQLRREATKLGSAKRELIPAIKGLPQDARFTLIAFGNGVTMWKSNLVEATSLNRNLVMYYIQKLSASGGTPAFTALKQAFQFSQIDTIFFQHYRQR